MNDAIFRKVLGENPFTALPAEYTDRYTPEVARQAGHKAGYQAALDKVIYLIQSTPRPSRQLKALLAEVERLEDESW